MHGLTLKKKVAIKKTYQRLTQPVPWYIHCTSSQRRDGNELEQEKIYRILNITFTLRIDFNGNIMELFVAIEYTRFYNAVQDKYRQYNYKILDKVFEIFAFS